MVFLKLKEGLENKVEKDLEKLNLIIKKKKIIILLANGKILFNDFKKYLITIFLFQFFKFYHFRIFSLKITKNIRN